MAFFNKNAKDWEKISTALKRADTIFISSHINPDGDAIGSEMALAGVLMKTRRNVRVINQSPTPENFCFLDPDNIIELYSENFPGNPPGKNDVVVILDLNSFDRLGDAGNFLLSGGAFIIVIDHHITQDIKADIAVINPKSESTGSLVYDLIFSEFRRALDVAVAQAALTAIVTDSGYFSYSNTTALTHRIVSSIYDQGGYLSDVRKKMENGQPFSRQKLLGYTLSEVKLSDCGRIAYSCITREMFEKSGALREYTEGIIDQIRIIKNIKIAMLFIEEDEGIFKLSLRSAAGLPVNSIAAALGGGGHPRAAGANLQGDFNNIVSKALDTAVEFLNDEDKISV
jgi:bifunctional oligoribonuclease and PAP phosphatase NrnA